MAEDEQGSAEPDLDTLAFTLEEMIEAYKSGWSDHARGRDSRVGRIEIADISAPEPRWGQYL